MKPDERERFEEELLEYLYDCHPDPEEIAGRLAKDAELCALLEHVRAEKALLDAAARGPALELSLPTPEVDTLAERDGRAAAASLRLPAAGPTRTTRPGGWLRAAVVLLALGPVSVALASWGWEARTARQVAGESLRLVVSGPSGVPAGAPTSLAVETWDVDGAPARAELAWTAFDADGGVLAEGAEATSGHLDLVLPADLAGARRVELVARRGPTERAATFTLSPTQDNPLAHLTTDKPAYRPGETVRFRATLLNRLTLAAREGSARLRLVDAKQAPVQSWTAPLADGVTAGTWDVPAGAAGGEYALELRDGTDAFTVERLAFLVRAFQPPRLAKEVDLDRETYAPGASGIADVSVERVEGGFAAGARLDGSLVIDGATVWSETRAADAFGRGRFAFVVPSDVERGDARFVCRVTDGGVVETKVEPFLVPTGALDVNFCPEGGELVAGVRTRVYAEITDPLGRPVSARGKIVDGAGRAVARLETEHQGRARFELEPRLAERYRLVFDEPQAADVELPDAVPNGVTLRAVGDGAAPGAPVELTVTTPDAGPWVAGLFCRGVLVAQEAFQGAGVHEVSLAAPDTVAGVLRVTVFDPSLMPVAERLVQRRSGRAIEVAIEPTEQVLLPGATQELAVTTRDEAGRPVSALLGLTVTDRAVRDLVGDVRVGLADQTWLVGDVEELEDVEEFLGGGPEAARHVDLLLGTRGWRRFAWFEPDQLLVDHGDEAKRVLLREGRVDVPRVLESKVALLGEVVSARSAARAAQRRVVVAGLLGFGVLAAAGVLWLVLRAVRARSPWRLVLWPVTAVATSFAALVLVIALLEQESADGVAARAFRPAPAAADARFGLEAEAQPLGEAAGEPVWAQGAVLFALEEPAGLALLDDLALIQDDGANGPAAPGFLLAEQALLMPLQEVGARLELGKLGYVENDEAFVGLLRLDQDARGLARRARTPAHLVQVRVYAHKNERAADAPRTDFAETVYWNPALRTAADGTARVRFDLSDRVTTWNVEVDGHGAGRVGQGLASFEAVQPFRMEAVLPFELTAGDRLELPIALTSGSDRVTEAEWSFVADPALLLGTASGVAPLTDGRGRVLVPLEVPEGLGARDGLKLAFSGAARGWKDAVERELRIVPRGFPVHVAEGGRVEGSTEFTLGVPADPVAGSLTARLVLYPSPLADMLDGLDGLLRTPSGCFEQASSSNYPNILVLAYLEAAAADEPAAMLRARELLVPGYQRIAGYECPERGYEWFGGDPGHEALTAYGLLEFHDMARVFDVDAEMVERTRAWLLGRRDGAGGFERNARALDSFGRAPLAVTNAYCTYALALTGEPAASIATELAMLEREGLESDDPYVVALAAGGLHAAGREGAADAARERLKVMQRADGGLVGTTKSITSSGGDDLWVETTSLAILAWLDDPEDAAHVERAVEFLLTKRRGGGTFGATQATIQALRALAAYAQENRRTASAGHVIVRVDDYEVARVPFAAGRRDAIVLDDLAASLPAGSHRVRIEVTGGNVFPWSFDLGYFAETPADAPDAKVELSTSLRRTDVEEGETVALDVVLRNRTDEGQPMTLAVIGLPAGLEAPTEVLDDLREAGRFDLWELSGRELALYWRDLAPGAEEKVTLDLVARLPGTTRGPASRAFLYYTSADKHWAAPLEVRVRPAGRGR